MVHKKAPNWFKKDYLKPIFLKDPLEGKNFRLLTLVT